MIGPNLSEWAISRKSLVVFLMLAAVIAGTLSFLRLGRAEDPVFTFRTMIVFAAWPGATLEDTLLQVTERVERKLQETRNIDRIRSYTTAGFTTMFVELKQSTPAKDVADIWYQVRKNVTDIRRTLPQGVIGPGFNDDFGDTYGTIYGFTGDGFSPRELRDYVEDIRSRLLLVTDVVMPGMSGGELAERLRASNPGLRVLFISGYMEAEEARRSIQVKGTAFLQKPFASPELARAVRSALANPV